MTYNVFGGTLNLTQSINRPSCERTTCVPATSVSMPRALNDVISNQFINDYRRRGVV